MQVPPVIVVAIPVKNEESIIGECLESMAAQTVSFNHLLLLLNNCTDRSQQICLNAQEQECNIRIIVCDLPDDLASAGEARRIALKHAASLAGDGVILTTDADATPAPDWIERNVCHIEQGADAVCGMAEIDRREGALLPHGLHFDSMREAFLHRIEDEIDALADPDAADPWPRHQQHSGASIAMRAAVLRAAGGAPHVASGEDRALIERLRLVDARIRHAPDIVVRVSGRVEGRAVGGMAEAIKRRLHRRDELTDDRLEPAVDAYRRALAKARLRNVHAGEDDGGLAEDLLIRKAAMARALRARHFGAAWADVQRLSPVLQRRRVPFASLAGETRQALLLRDHLLRAASHRHAASGQLFGNEIAG
jgi:glycosyltransferase involved in cell wall biosynthesis